MQVTSKVGNAGKVSNAGIYKMCNRCKMVMQVTEVR